AVIAVEPAVAVVPRIESDDLETALHQVRRQYRPDVTIHAGDKDAHAGAACARCAARSAVRCGTDLERGAAADALKIPALWEIDDPVAVVDVTTGVVDRRLFDVQMHGVLQVVVDMLLQQRFEPEI